MWATIHVQPSKEKILYLPDSIAQSVNSSLLVIYGTKFDLVNVLSLKDTDSITGHDFNNPLIIEMTSKLSDNLLITKNIPYRLIIEKNRIKIGPTVGLLLGNKNHIYTPEYMYKYSDRLGIYNSIGGLICAFSPSCVNWDNHSAFGLYYNYLESKWQYSNFPLPEVIYRRNFHNDSNSIKKLIEITNNKLFNSYRFTKYDLYEYVMNNVYLKDFLPETELFTDFGCINKLLNKYDKIILKPVNLSRGRGIQIIEKINDIYIIHDYRFKKTSHTLLGDLTSVKNYYEQNKKNYKNYLVQQYLELSKVFNSVFDIRIVMQKISFSTWKCSGIECRVAKFNSLITNISKGGYPLSIYEALLLTFPNNSDYKVILKDIDDFCNNLCTYLDKMGHHFAEFGIDIGIDKNKKLWLIEVNVFPSFNGFKAINYDTYLNIRYNPLKYALSLTDFGSANNIVINTKRTEFSN